MDVEDSYVDDDCEIRKKYDRFVLLYMIIFLYGKTAIPNLVVYK